MNEALELGRGGKGKALGKSTLRPSAQPEGSSLSISRLSLGCVAVRTFHLKTSQLALYRTHMSRELSNLPFESKNMSASPSSDAYK